MSKFFIVGNYQKPEDGIFVIVNEDDSVMLFDIEDDAIAVATNNMHCVHFGYEIFERGTGSS